MRWNTVAAKCLVLSFMGIMALLSISAGEVAAADGGLNLPSTLVRIEVANGTESYFDTALSDVPSGYDVVNATYAGWCVDRTADMARSPAVHEVTLYSSTDAPGTLAGERWDMVNYVLNHKNGTAWDIQQAIWYFVNMNGTYFPTSDAAYFMVYDAQNNGNAFVPESGQAMAVICLPKVLLPGTEEVQISIIEVATPTIPEFPSPMVLVLFLFAALSIVIVCKRKRVVGGP